MREVIGKAVWGKHPVIGKRAHLWTVIDESVGKRKGVFMVGAACGAISTAIDGVPFLYIGDWPRCKLCERVVAKKPAFNAIFAESGKCHEN